MTGSTPLPTRRPLLERLEIARAGIQHLLDGLDPSILEAEGGSELIEDRLASLPDNVRVVLSTAKWARR